MSMAMSTRLSVTIAIWITFVTVLSVSVSSYAQSDQKFTLHCVRSNLIWWDITIDLSENASSIINHTTYGVYADIVQDIQITDQQISWVTLPESTHTFTGGPVSMYLDRNTGDLTLHDRIPPDLVVHCNRVQKQF